MLISCERKQPNFSEEMIEKLADRGEIRDGIILPPAPMPFSDVYINTTNDEFFLVDSNELIFFYKKYYFKKFNSYKDFLNAVLNNGFIFDKKLFKNSGYPQGRRLNSKIEKEYADLGFDEFLKKYSKPSRRKGVLELNKSIIESDEYVTVTYFMFKHRYDISTDCYIGKDYIRKRKDAFN